MGPLKSIELLLLSIVVILIFMIYRWFKKRHELCNRDGLCYITGEKTTITNSVNQIFKKLF